MAVKMLYPHPPPLYKMWSVYKNRDIYQTLLSYKVSKSLG